MSHLQQASAGEQIRETLEVSLDFDDVRHPCALAFLPGSRASGQFEEGLQLAWCPVSLRLTVFSGSRLKFIDVGKDMSTVRNPPLMSSPSSHLLRPLVRPRHAGFSTAICSASPSLRMYDPLSPRSVCDWATDLCDRAAGLPPARMTGVSSFLTPCSHW